MQVSWIDPEEVANLAESLRPPVRPQARGPMPEPEPVEPLVVDASGTAAAPVTGAGDSSMPNLAAFRQRLQAIRDKAIHAGLLTPQASDPEPNSTLPSTPEPSAENVAPEVIQPAVAEPISAPPAIQPPAIEMAPGASVKERLDTFAAWAIELSGTGELLIVDEYGDLLWGPPRKSGLVLSTMMAWNAAIRASAQAASGATQVLHQILTTGDTLTIIPCQTRLGMLQLALVKNRALQDNESALLRTTLLQVMDITG
ncbi:hypothetical protein EI77_03775 [Prosthecobacter fusiformis]|uniref:Roadblock/LC7 domain-containing protein n=1 Tax=Prosthecobacter fusiformis TaxID=48464 RepID=A0A4R7RML9_9BACT|nr:hypothetical protein [Prosthecobacter fusiformis]TDU66038.1 hypothetical protein EI77_03775 [Prosthecobacter fusiformis]